MTTKMSSPQALYHQILRHSHGPQCLQIFPQPWTLFTPQQSGSSASLYLVPLTLPFYTFPPYKNPSFPDTDLNSGSLPSGHHPHVEVKQQLLSNIAANWPNRVSPASPTYCRLTAGDQVSQNTLLTSGSSTSRARHVLPPKCAPLYTTTRLEIIVPSPDQLAQQSWVISSRAQGAGVKMVTTAGFL